MTAEATRYVIREAVHVAGLMLTTHDRQMGRQAGAVVECLRSRLGHLAQHLIHPAPTNPERLLKLLDGRARRA